MRFSSGLAIAVLSFAGVDAFWRLPCAAPLVTERADPIVNPGKVAGHVHTIMGKLDASSSSKRDTLTQLQVATASVST